jgi:hypothetical protein
VAPSIVGIAASTLLLEISFDRVNMWGWLSEPKVVPETLFDFMMNAS